MKTDKYKKSLDINKRFHEIVPAASHTYSKGDDQFPEISPKIMSHAKGALTWDIDGNKFIDWAMGNRVMILGHAYSAIDEKVYETICRGTNFTKPGILEFKLAEYLVNLMPSAEMIKFGKNGSDVTTAAVKLARAYTNRKHILVCKEHPFFSIHDWFIGSTDMNSGTLPSERQYTAHFSYNNRESVEQAFEDYKDDIAAIILEPVKNTSPYDNPKESDYTKEGLTRDGDQNNFLQFLRDKTTETGTVLIFDEMISGMRFDIRGAHHLYGVYPDLVTYGKAIANGYSCSILAGKKELMELGGLHHDKERVFLLSQTHGSETTGLAATLATMEECEKVNISEHVWETGNILKKRFRECADAHGLEDYARIIGFDANPQITCTKKNGDPWPELNTLFHQYIVEQGILIPWISITYSHTAEHLDTTIQALDKTLEQLKGDIKNNTVNESLIGSHTMPVFRKFNR